MFITRISDDLRSRYAEVTHIANLCREQLQGCPAGRLKIQRQNNNVYYRYILGNDKSEVQVLKPDDPLICSLAQKAYMQTLLRISVCEQKLLEDLLRKYPEPSVEDLFETLSAERQKLISPIMLPNDKYIQKWLAKPYTRKKISDDIPVYLTMNGERVRSKSEQIIADRLFAAGIPYKYECPLYFDDFVVHPDFTILRLSDRREIYYEHLGRMDDPSYAEDNVRKITFYSLNGYTLGDNLFTTMETRKNPLDVRVLNELIEKNFR